MNRFLRSLAAIFTPPFDGLALIVVLYVVWAHLVYPHNDVLRGNLPDPDDYMYLDQVLDWLKGQGWYDNVQHRLDPPGGVPIHFSRFVMMPLAAGIWLFEKLGLPAKGAATLTALIEPMLLLGLCLGVLRRVAATVVPANWAGASAYITLFSVPLLFEFMPGHVDHHGLVIALIVAAAGCVLRLMDEPENTKLAVAAGIILAATMMIALEALPWVLMLSGWLGLWSLRQGGKAAASGAIFGLAYFATSTLCLAVTRPPANWGEFDILAYSAVYVILGGCIALPFVAAAATTKSSAARWAVGLTVAGIYGGLFLHRFPELLSGPYGGIDPQLVPILLDTVEEAKPILQTDNGSAHMLNFMGMGIIGLSAALVFVWRGRGAVRAKWGLIALMLGTAMGLTVFYQYRFLGMQSALAVIPLTALLQRGLAHIRAPLDGRSRFLAEIGLLLLVGPLPAVIGPALFDGRSFNTGILLFPVDSGRNACDTAQLEKLLRDPNGLGNGPKLIAAPMEMGPELLFRTKDTVLAAPFHMNVQGNLDAVRLLSTPYPDEAERIARRRGVDLVVACRAVTKLYLAPKNGAPSVMELLFTGPAPGWMERVDAPNVGNFVVFRIKKP